MTAHLTRVQTRLTLHAHRKVRGLLDGEYASVQTGRGIDFADLREYVPGDDVKDLDWKASARAGKPLVKRFVAERKHTVLLAVSTGRSMAAQNDLDVAKRDLAVFCAGLIGQLATKHGDLVSLVHGDAERQHARPPGGGDLHLERHLATIHDATTPTSSTSDIAAVLRYVAKVVRRQTIMAVITDEPVVDDETARLLRRLAVQHEVLHLTIGDLNPTLADLNTNRDQRRSNPGRDSAAATEERGRRVGGIGSSEHRGEARTAERSRDTGDPTSNRHHHRSLIDIDTGTEVPDWLRGDAQLAKEWATQVMLETGSTRRRLDTLGIAHERVHDDASAVRAVFSLLERHRRARRR